jgi:hypothetical protein
MNSRATCRSLSEESLDPLKDGAVTSEQKMPLAQSTSVTHDESDGF